MDLTTDGVIDRAITLWRDRVRMKLREAEQTRSFAAEVDLQSLADHVWTVFERAFVLARSTDDLGRVRDQLAHLRTLLNLLLSSPTISA